MFEKLKFGFALIILVALNACIKQKHELPIDENRPTRKLTEYLDKKYLLYQLPDTSYLSVNLRNSFSEIGNTLTDGDLSIEFLPLGYSPALNLQYTHVYSPDCVYHIHDNMWKFAEVCFPNTCITKDWAYAKVKIENQSKVARKIFARLFYQNTSYSFPINSVTDFSSTNYLDNFYGASHVVAVEIPALQSTEILVPYSIGLDPKNENELEPFKVPARPGNYEFALLTMPDTSSPLMRSNLNLQQTNPFAEIKKDEISNSKKYYPHTAYVGSHHFKFVFLDEYFDGSNDLQPNHIYIPKDRDQKKLCDTCSGWFKSVIHENWDTRHFFSGFIKNALFTKAEYGIRKENFSIDTSGILLTMPASRRGDYQKTWGEFLFGPSFKYGHLTVRAKFAQILNRPGSPNGIIHNLWLYQADPPEPDSTDFYKFKDYRGKQPYEIDFEFWSCIDEQTSWDDAALIHYAIVDYFKDTSVAVKPFKKKTVAGWKSERLKPIQVSVPNRQFQRDFFNQFHTYELYWTPTDAKFYVDGELKAYINNRMAKIPDKHLFLWIGSPMYQDGTYYDQSLIPFMKTNKYTLVDYIKIE